MVPFDQKKGKQTSNANQRRPIKKNDAPPKRHGAQLTLIDSSGKPSSNELIISRAIGGGCGRFGGREKEKYIQKPFEFGQGVREKGTIPKKKKKGREQQRPGASPRGGGADAVPGF